MFLRLKRTVDLSGDEPLSISIFIQVMYDGKNRDLDRELEEVNGRLVAFPVVSITDSMKARCASQSLPTDSPRQPKVA